MVIADIIKDFDQTCNDFAKTYYGLHTNAPAPSIKYEVAINTAEPETIRNFMVVVKFEALVQGNTKQNLLVAKLETLQLVHNLKERLVEKGFRFVSIEDAVVFDNKGNVIDNPAFLVVFTKIAEF